MLVTAFLRAFWFLEKNTVLSDEDILGAFYDLERVLGFEDGHAIVKLDPEIHRGSSPEAAARVAEDIKPPRHREPVAQAGKRLTGKVILEPNQELTSTVLSELRSRRVAPFKVVYVDPAKNDAAIYETLARDTHKNPDEALVEMYRRLRPGDPPTVESARALFRGMFLDPRRYDLARVGRFMLNKKLGVDSPLNHKTLRAEDVVHVVRHLLLVRQGAKPTH